MLRPFPSSSNRTAAVAVAAAATPFAALAMPHPSSSQSTGGGGGHVSSVYPSASACRHTPSSATLDLLILLLVLFSVAFLLASSLAHVSRSLSPLLASPPAAAVLASGAAAMPYLGAVAALAGATFLSCSRLPRRRCRNPRCRGLVKALEFDVQLQTEEAVRAGTGAQPAAPTPPCGARSRRCRGRAARVGTTRITSAFARSYAEWHHQTAGLSCSSATGVDALSLSSRAGAFQRASAGARGARWACQPMEGSGEEKSVRPNGNIVASDCHRVELLK